MSVDVHCQGSYTGIQIQHTTVNSESSILPVFYPFSILSAIRSLSVSLDIRSIRQLSASNLIHSNQLSPPAFFRCRNGSEISPSVCIRLYGVFCLSSLYYLSPYDSVYLQSTKLQNTIPNTILRTEDYRPLYSTLYSTLLVLGNLLRPSRRHVSDG